MPSMGDRLKRIALGRQTKRTVSPAERARTEAAEMGRRQSEALARATKEQSAKRPPRPMNRRTAAPSDRPQLTGGLAPVVQTILTPAGRLAEHDWQLLRPAELSPYYDQIDEETLRGLLAEAAVENGEGDGAGVLRYIAPTYAVENKLHYELNDRYHTTLAVKKWPAGRFTPQIWQRLLIRPTVNLSLHYWRIDTIAAEKGLREELSRIEVDMMAVREGKRRMSEVEVADLRARATEVEAKLERVVNRTEMLFHVSCYLHLSAESEAGLAAEIESVNEWSRRLGLQLTQIPGDQRRAMIGSMPFSADPANLTTRINTNNAARLLPMLSRGYADREVDGTPRGVLYGVHAAQRTPVLMTPWNTDGTTQITTVLGMMGSGKTFWTRLHIGRLAMTGARILAVDPVGDSFVRWFSNNEGQVFTIAPGSGSYINPLKRELIVDEEDGQTQFEPASAKISRLMLLFSLLLDKQFNAQAEGLLSTALDSWYASFPEHEERLMADFLEFMLGMKTYRNGDPLSPSQLQMISQLYDSLRPICLEGPQRDFFSHPTNIDLTNNRICFNLKAAGEGRNQIFAIYMAITLAIAEARKDSRKTLVVIDEIHKLFDAAGEVAALDKWINDLVRTSRHWNTAITFITQFFDEEEGTQQRAKTSLLKGTGTFVLMRATETMLKQTAALRESFDPGLLAWLKGTPEEVQADRSSAKRMVIYRDDQPIPAHSVALDHEKNEDDTYHGPGREAR